MANDINSFNSNSKETELNILKLETAIKNLNTTFSNINFNGVANQLKTISTDINNVSNSIEKTKGPIDVFVDGIDGFIEYTSKFKNVTDGIDGVTKTLNNMFGLNIASFFDSTSKSLQGIVEVSSGVSSALSGVSGSASSLAVITETTTKSTGLLSSAMGFLSANPIPSILIGLGALAIGFLACASNTDTLTDKEKEQIKISEELKQKSQELADTQRDLNESFKSSTDGINADYAVTAEYYNKLLALTGPDGYVGNLEEAQLYVQRLNELGLDGISINENGQLVQEQTTEAYEKQIEQMRIKAMLQANQDAYGNALIKQNEVLNNVTTAQQDVNDAQEDYNAIIGEYVKQGMSYDEALNQAILDNGAFGEVLYNANEALDEANKALVANQEAITDQEALVKLSTGTIQEQAQANIDLALTYSDVVGAGGEVSYKWKDMQAELANYDQAMLDHNNGVTEMSATEIEQNQAARDYLIQCMTEKGLSLGYTLDEMKTKLGNTYTNMTDEEKSALDQQYQNMIDNGTSIGAELARQKDEALQMLKDHNIDVDSETGRQYLEDLKTYQENGEGLGRIYLDSMSDKLKSKKPEVDVNTNPGVMNVEKLMGLASFKKTATADVEFQTSTSGFDLGGAGFLSIMPMRGVKKMADGGFPDTGELFIAREAGPELVGRINGKNAVANNDQIVTGISSGVYQAVRSAMSGYGGKGNFNINATFMMDSEVVGKQIIKYHNGVVKRTGNTPLLV
ncbi:MAG: hypothetical protein ACK5LC_12235 [Coprobacillaceae bacterium]